MLFVSAFLPHKSVAFAKKLPDFMDFMKEPLPLILIKIIALYLLLFRCIKEVMATPLTFQVGEPPSVFWVVLRHRYS